MTSVKSTSSKSTTSSSRTQQTQQTQSSSSSSTRRNDSPSFEQAKSGNYIRRGQQGDSIQQLQERMNAAGIKPPLETDGKFGPQTEAAIRKFQAANGCKVDGIVGPETLGALENGGTFAGPDPARQKQAHATGGEHTLNAPTEGQRNAAPTGNQVRAGDLQRNDNARLARAQNANVNAGGPNAPGRADRPFDSTKAAREAQAEQLLKNNGMWPPTEGKNYAIQIDQDSPKASASARDKADYYNKYTGQTAVYKCVDGRLVETAAPMRSASHPGQRKTTAGTDIDRNGTDDISHLRSGSYEYRKRPNGSGRFNPTDNRNMTVARDTNQDGVISDAENQASLQRGDYATGLQIHAGKSYKPSSIGCQTMPPKDYDRFSSAVRDGDGSTFSYLLVRRPNDVHGANPL
jgi:peptidoglycan hydrolase-like protein with peptidoglycan-binding domain